MSRKMIDYKVEGGKITSIDNYKVGGDTYYNHYLTLSNTDETANILICSKNAEPFTLETLIAYFLQFGSIIYLPARTYDSDYKRYGFFIVCSSTPKQIVALYYRTDTSKGIYVNSENIGQHFTSVADTVMPA